MRCVTYVVEYITKYALITISLSLDWFGWLVGWLVGCIDDLRRFSGISAISRLGSGRKPISEIQVARRGIEPGHLAPQAKSLTTQPTPLPRSGSDALPNTLPGIRLMYPCVEVIY